VALVAYPPVFRGLRPLVGKPPVPPADGHKPYLEAVEGAFGGAIDYAMLVKIY
jgi:hypothetical protein